MQMENEKPQLVPVAFRVLWKENRMQSDSIMSEAAKATEPHEPGCLAPSEEPLYITVEAAAKLAGVSQGEMRKWVNSRIRPIPHLKCGNKCLVRANAIEGYCRQKEIV